jgi:hypothetical protein
VNPDCPELWEWGKGREGSSIAGMGGVARIAEHLTRKLGGLCEPCDLDACRNGDDDRSYVQSRCCRGDLREAGEPAGEIGLSTIETPVTKED